ncbi:MAG: hypothetical protein IJO14_01650 [Clostridia bacterium]|nr:hypothetical protein [Clostridia bacterium]
MSYCVHCGVELDDSAARCVLCNTPVCNPNKPPQDLPTPYSEKVLLPPQVRRRFTAFLLSMILLLPNIVCLLTNLFLPGDIFWAKYVNITSLFVWILFLFPFLLKKIPAFVLVLIDSLSVLGYVFFFYMDFEQSGWFLRVAVPTVAVLALSAGFTIEWCQRKKPDWPYIVFAVFLEVSVFSVFAGVSLYYQLSSVYALLIGSIAAVSALMTAFFFLAVKHNRHLRAWLSRRFFF